MPVHSAIDSRPRHAPGLALCLLCFARYAFFCQSGAWNLNSRFNDDYRRACTQGRKRTRIRVMLAERLR